MDNKVLRPYFLLALLLGCLVVVYYIFAPFLIPLTLAAVFSVVLQPLYKKILGLVRLPAVAAGSTLLISVVCIVVPLTFLSVLIANEARQLYYSLTYGEGRTQLFMSVHYIEATLRLYFPQLVLPDLYGSVDTYARQALLWLMDHLGMIFSGIASLLVSFFIFMFAFYYFLRDGVAFKKALIEVSPLDADDSEAISSRLEIAILSVVRGNLAIALIQGTMTAVGFTIFGVENSILWGMVAAIASLIPGVGTALVLMPGALFMFLTGHEAAGIGLLLWGLVAVGTIDNILGPRLIGRGMRLHPLMVMLAVLGGLSFFGPVGVFLGPLWMSLLLAVLAVYTRTSGTKHIS